MADLRLQREWQAAKLEVEKAKQTTELETECLRQEAISSKESEGAFREQLKSLLEELSKADK